MLYRDDVLWADQELELRQDETSRRFLDYLDKWFTLAERLYDEVDDSGDRKRSVVKSVRLALSYLEADPEWGYLSMEWIGQMLLLAQQHWIHGEWMERGLTVLERRMLEQMTAVKMVELQESASDTL